MAAVRMAVVRMAAVVSLALGLSGAATAPATARAAGIVDRPLPTTGCGKAPSVRPGHSSTEYLVSGGVRRGYLLHVPDHYQPHRPYALVLSFHGHKRTSAYQEELTGMSALNAITVYPQGLVGTDGQTAWEGAPYSADVDDVLFTSDLITRLQGGYCVDPHRIYAAGKSNGGGFTGVLACRMAGRIAAFAPVSGAFYPQGGPCEPSRPVPIADFHGTADTTIPYDGDPARGLPDLPSWLNAWAARDRCRPRPAEHVIAGNVTVQDWRGCARGSALRHYRIAGAGHVWPSTSPNLDSPTPTSIDATPLIWEFFQRHPLPAA
jgi:polyhydroxybutyrate depolymerase